MKKLLSHSTSLASKITRQHIRLALIILTLSLFVLGAGAPAMDGGPGGF